MDDHTLFGGSSAARSDYKQLAQWLQQVLTPVLPTEQAVPVVEDEDSQLELVLHNDYHPHFYQQLPDFALALLKHDVQATLHYAPLLYHLTICTACHTAYLEIYDALRSALHPQGPRPQLGQGAKSLAALPPRMLSHLCQSLISQAEAVLLQGRHEHTDYDIVARSLLQLALGVSKHIGQYNVRRLALQDLVRVATLFDGPSAPANHDPASPAFTPVLAATGRVRRGTAVRHPESLHRGQPGEPAVIHLQSQSLEGTIVQRGQLLELHLHDLSEALRSKRVVISVLLGSLLEPIRWTGGNPRSIVAPSPVDTTGSLTMILGATDLQLSNPEERNLLEAIFMQLEVRINE